MIIINNNKKEIIIARCSQKMQRRWEQCTDKANWYAKKWVLRCRLKVVTHWAQSDVSGQLSSIWIELLRQRKHVRRRQSWSWAGSALGLRMTAVTASVSGSAAGRWNKSEYSENLVSRRSDQDNALKCYQKKVKNVFFFLDCTLE